jgi:hypothetical protein
MCRALFGSADDGWAGVCGHGIAYFRDVLSAELRGTDVGLLACRESSFSRPGIGVPVRIGVLGTRTVTVAIATLARRPKYFLALISRFNGRGYPAAHVCAIIVAQLLMAFERYDNVCVIGALVGNVIPESC